MRHSFTFFYISPTDYNIMINLQQRTKKDAFELLLSKVQNGNSVETSSKGSNGCDPLLQVVLFKFGKKETTGEIPCLEIPIIYEVKVCKRFPIWLLAHGLPIWPFARGLPTWPIARNFYQAI